MAATFLILRSPGALLVMRSIVAMISQSAWTAPLTLIGVVRIVCTPCTYLQTATMHASGILDEPATLMACRSTVTGRRLVSGCDRRSPLPDLDLASMSCCSSHISWGFRSSKPTASAKNDATADTSLDSIAPEMSAKLQFINRGGCLMERHDA